MSIEGSPCGSTVSISFMHRAIQPEAALYYVNCIPRILSDTLDKTLELQFV